ncbi:MAG: sulfurtransferase-like selenium metabolism protein YedF [Negativicutes bacterium]
MSDELNKIAAELDCQGMACPMPVIMTKKALEQRPEILTVLVDNTAAKENVTKFATANGYGVSIEQEGDLFRLRLTAVAGAASPQARAQENGPVFLISRNTLGAGDDQLGAILMKSFFVSLQEQAPLPQTLLLLNGGVHLAAEGSPVLTGLQELSRRGVKILVCGTCLDFFHLKDKLAVGSVTNMYSILQELAGASRAITL